MNLKPNANEFWKNFVAAQLRSGRPRPELYDAMVIGTDEASGDAGAALILEGRKTATSALQSEFESVGLRPPQPGDFSLVIDGRSDPVCIVQTVAVIAQPLGNVDEAFARDYGEWDGTLATWRLRMLAYYNERLSAEPFATPLVCERFVRVWPCLDGESESGSNATHCFSGPGA